MSFKSSKLVILNFCAQTLGFLVDTIFFIKHLARLIHADILVPVSEVIVVVILSEWWLFYLSGG